MSNLYYEPLGWYEYFLYIWNPFSFQAHSQHTVSFHSVWTHNRCLFLSKMKPHEFIFFYGNIQPVKRKYFSCQMSIHNGRLVIMFIKFKFSVHELCFFIVTHMMFRCKMHLTLLNFLINISVLHQILMERVKIWWWYLVSLLNIWVHWWGKSLKMTVGSILLMVL